MSTRRNRGKSQGEMSGDAIAEKKAFMSNSFRLVFTAHRVQIHSSNLKVTFCAPFCGSLLLRRTLFHQMAVKLRAFCLPESVGPHCRPSEMPRGQTHKSDRLPPFSRVFIFVMEDAMSNHQGSKSAMKFPYLRMLTRPRTEYLPSISPHTIALALLSLCSFTISISKARHPSPNHSRPYIPSLNPWSVQKKKFRVLAVMAQHTNSCSFSLLLLSQCGRLSRLFFHSFRWIFMCLLRMLRLPNELPQ